ncbi:histidyl-tRNA synthetase [Tangfeifania diversioriginum]|uniref:Histidine--tRNA ligase n=1 Tax=Tangfeifania diversioriginum TaxID=1168035 RepID=A0A1M6A0I1_9BACT|nr:histidine--tRNA ligase [Tangfeifania diversioriginum]SHI29985.1 histidyl-tRNA synthetase [Tangfeifania diversioriginum]
MAQKPSIPKGTRDFSPAEMVRRNYIFDTIKDVFRLYGFQPIETPAMENLSTLMGKYGEEGDKLLFKILNSGDFVSKVSDDVYNEKDSVKLTSQISEKGLRYDLTVPFARFVVQHQNEITFPFKRYQIQPVWRADRPQKGRYREFYQCDVDVIGSTSLLNEAELIQIIDKVFKRLKIETIVKINNRKILAGIAETIGEKERITDITVAIDKLEKIGLEKVNEELSAKGVSDEAIQKLQPILDLEGDTASKLGQLEEIISTSGVGVQGIEEMKTLFSYLEKMNLATNFELDLTLARGLNYYTGAIIEVKAKDVEMGSICGGGRYDDLTGIFGLKDVSGVGVSFGAERIYDVLTQLDLFPPESTETTKVLFVNFGEKEEAYCLPMLSKLRASGINAEIYPDSAKMKKQMNYANKKDIPFVVLAGESEMAAQKFTLKNMESGEQTLVTSEDLIKILS